MIKLKSILSEDWSKKYKDSINCDNPKGFSQKAHCAGKEKKESVNESSIAPGSKEYFNSNMSDTEILELVKELTKYPVSKAKTPAEMQRFFKDVANILGLPNQAVDVMTYDDNSVGYMDRNKFKMNVSKAVLFKMYKDKKLDMKTYGEIQKGLMEKYKQLGKKIISLLMFSRGAY
jgi:hypothetical protein